MKQKFNAKIKGNILQINWDTYTVNQLKEFDNDSAIKPRKLSHSAPGTPEDYYFLDEDNALSLMDSSQPNQGQERGKKKLTRTVSVSDLPSNLTDVNEINNHFVDQSHSSELPDEELIHQLENNRKLNVTDFDFNNVDENTVYQALLSMKSNEVGVDDISLNMSPHNSRYHSYQLQWKTSFVIPQPKIKTTSELSQYTKM
ncbi:hypothetical protein JTB14_035419 [Gonioctena quinquepunctata]|nr:hypothetical protein JTB14_035419 [Gonioctena quinquepunctata]